MLLNPWNDKVLFVGNRKENVYKIKIDACMRLETRKLSYC